MPNRILTIAFALTALTLAACGYGNNNGLYGPVPTAAPSVTLTPNPTVTAAIIIVTASGSPLPSQPVTLSNSDASGHLGTPIATQTTDPTGQTTFTGLTGAAFYCFTTGYTPPGSLAQQKSYCGQFWQNGVTLAF